jgi:hypothetical protein
MGVGFGAGVAGLDQHLDLFAPERLDRRFLCHAWPRHFLHRVGHLELGAGPGEEGGQADVEIVDRLVGELAFFPAGDTARHVLAAQVVQEFEQVS